MADESGDDTRDGLRSRRGGESRRLPIVFHFNDMPLFYCLRDTTIYWWKISAFRRCYPALQSRLKQLKWVPLGRRVWKLVSQTRVPQLPDSENRDILLRWVKTSVYSMAEREKTGIPTASNKTLRSGTIWLLCVGLFKNNLVFQNLFQKSQVVYCGKL